MDVVRWLIYCWSGGLTENKSAADYAREQLDLNMGNSVTENQQLTQMILKLEASEV